ncbi:hypothetical protein [Pedococcus bigeumensis]|uniref:hypothetical protein n=1 Tax=Pedococcus bigeumensis TaxID=433644 RepID=UPI002FECA24D
MADMKSLLRQRGVRRELAVFFGTDPRAITGSDALAAESTVFLANAEESYARPGWTVLATDVSGMPWGYRDPSRSHGTWASHDDCGTVQKLSLARTECRVCPPEPVSRTHRAKAGQPQYLYLVRIGGLLKFGHGDANRVKAHLRRGCEPISVLRAPFQQVVAAEAAMKRAYRDSLIDPTTWDLPTTFGAGTEVVTDDVVVELSKYLLGAGVIEVTSRFR